MKINGSILLTIAGVILFITFACAEEGAFLKTGVGTRAISLGRSYVAIADDSTAFYWNPAGLTQLKLKDILMMYSKPFEGRIGGVDYHTLSWGFPLGRGGLGGGVVYSIVDGIDRYNEAGEHGGTFKNIERAIFLSYGCSLTPTFSLGASLKEVCHEVDKYRGNGLGVDVGGLYRPSPNLRFGLLLQDLVSPSLSLTGGKGEPFPLKANFGISYRLGGPDWLNKSGILFTIGTLYKDKEAFKPRGGLEFQPVEFLSIRGGYDGMNEEVGVGVGVNGGILRLDYNYGNHNFLKETHRASFGIRW